MTDIQKGILEIVSENYVLVPHGMTREEYITDLVLSYLHENGVVRKVEGELPKNIVDLAALSTSGKLAAVEPLIKEESNE